MGMSDAASASEYESEVESEWEDEPLANEDAVDDDDEEDDEDEDDEELEDPLTALKEKCLEKKEFAAYKAKLDSCTERVEGGSKESCLEEFQDFLHHVDHCVAHHLFHDLK